MPDYLWRMPLLALALGYLLGSIPFGLLLTRLFGAGDLRQVGSGNIGATNVLRTGRKELAVATLLLDAAKGAAAVLIGAALAPGGALLGGAGAFFGHCYPAWLRFKGGKGIATLGGIALAAYWPIGLIYFLVWLVMFALTRISSVAGMSAAVAAPVTAAAFGRFELALLFLALALIVLWAHRGNIDRLMSGTETKVGRQHG